MGRIQLTAIILISAILNACGSSSGGNNNSTSSTSSSPSSAVSTSSASSSSTSISSPSISSTSNSSAISSSVSSLSSTSSSISSTSSANSSNGSELLTDTLRYYVFGHSLFIWDAQIESGSTAESSTGYWLGLLAQQNGLNAGGVGQFGQLSYHQIPPNPNWGFTTNTLNPWVDDLPFAQQTLSHIVIMPSNFEQNYLTPQEYMADTQRVLDHVVQHQPNVQVILYEHWPEPPLSGSVNNGADLSDQEWETYRNYTTGAYHQWFVEWQNLIRAQYPSTNIRMIPIGPVITLLLEQSNYLNDVTYTDLYADDAPHGTRNTYFLAALVMYRALYGANPNPIIALSSEHIHTAFRDNFSQLVNDIETWLSYYDQNGVLVYPQ